MGGDRRLLLFGTHIDAHQRLRPLERGGLGEMHDVDRRLFGLQQIGDGLVHRSGGVAVVERHGPLGIGHQRRCPAGAPGEVLTQDGHVAERRRHQQELGRGQFQQRHLPGPAAVGIAVEMELVHHHQTDVRLCALPERDVRQDLGRARDDRCPGVDRRVAGEHADVGGAENVTQREELLTDQCLDRRGVVTAPIRSEGEIDRAGGHQRFAGTGRRRQHHVGATDQLDQRLLLRRIQRSARRLGPLGERREQFLGVGAGGAQGGQVRGVVKKCHRGSSVPDHRPRGCGGQGLAGWLV